MKKVFLDYNLPISIFKEGGQFIAYTPALDLSTSGKSYEEVKKRFREVTKIFFEEVTKKGTLQEALEELGWQKINNRWLPPVVVAHEEENVRISVAR